MVDGGQKDVELLFDQQSDLMAASDGYLIDVINYRKVSTPSSVRLNLDNVSTMQGLTNKAYANSVVNVEMRNGSIWNMAVKTNGAVATSTLDTLMMSTGSTLNAFNQLNAAKTSATRFIMVGQVSSDASTINLWDPIPTPDDTLTINGNYVGANSAVLTVDTCMGNDSAPSDVLVVNGDVSGATILRVNPATLSDPSCQGALTTKGILVVQVAGASSGNSFVLEGGTVTAGNYAYELVQADNKNWYLQSKALTGTLTVKKVVAAPVGAPAFSGSFPYTFTCTTPDSTGEGTIAVTDNQGSVSHTLQAGSQCAVEEGLLPSAPVGYKWASPVVTQPTGVIPPEGEQVATITNTLLALPVATVVCNPATLTDSEGQVSTCTVTLSAPAPANGLPIAITPPTSNPRYTATTCTSPLTVAAGATTASCTITAVANTVVGDGDVVATLALLAGEGYMLGEPHSATVTVQDDDKAAGTPTPIPTLGQWSLMLLGLGIAGLAARRRRLH